MVDGFAALTGSVTILGTVGGIVTTVAALGASGGRRHVERAQGASSMLTALEQLPQQNGTRFVTPGKDDELRAELSRIVRENAASYVKRNPTPAGLDFARVLMPGYLLLFALFAVSAFVAAAHGGGGGWGDSVAGVVFVAGSLAFLVITAVLYERMVRRNDARRLAGTPGREYYFGPLVEMWQLISGIVRKRRARRKAAELQR